MASRQIFNRKTGFETKDAIFGLPCKLSENVSLTYLAIGQALLYTQLKMAFESKGNHMKNIPFPQIINHVAKQVKTLWENTSIPCIGDTAIRGRMNKIWKKSRKLLQSKNKNLIKNQIKIWSKPFDIAKNVDK